MSLEFLPKKYSLKSGHSITIRPPAQEEAEALVNLKRSYIENATTIPLTLKEYPRDIIKEQKLIADYNQSPNSILLVSEINSELIGNIDLSGSKRSKMSHTAMIGMGIKEDWRNQGLGTYLIEAVIDWAKNYSDLELIWLDVYASNEAGLKLYKKTGFKVSGTIEGFFKEEDGYKGKVQMYRHIKSRKSL